MPAARPLALCYPTPPVKEVEAGAVEEVGDADCPLVEDGERLASEARGREGVEEVPVVPLLRPPRPQLPQRLPLLLRMLLMASPSKGQALLIPLHPPRGLVQWLLVQAIPLCQGMVILVIQWLGMTAQLGIRLLRVRRTALRNPRHILLSVLTVSSLHRLHEMTHRLSQKFNNWHSSSPSRKLGCFVQEFGCVQWSPPLWMAYVTRKI